MWKIKEGEEMAMVWFFFKKENRKRKEGGCKAKEKEIDRDR